MSFSAEIYRRFEVQTPRFCSTALLIRTATEVCMLHGQRPSLLSRFSVSAWYRTLLRTSEQHKEGGSEGERVEEAEPKWNGGQTEKETSSTESFCQRSAAQVIEAYRQLGARENHSCPKDSRALPKRRPYPHLVLQLHFSLSLLSLRILRANESMRHTDLPPLHTPPLTHTNIHTRA